MYMIAQNLVKNFLRAHVTGCDRLTKKYSNLSGLQRRRKLYKGLTRILQQQSQQNCQKLRAFLSVVCIFMMIWLSSLVALNNTKSFKSPIAQGKLLFENLSRFEKNCYLNQLQPTDPIECLIRAYNKFRQINRRFRCKTVKKIFFLLL